ncbi:MAG: prepilin-type cleavage/methylation domain-containing protein, partial [Acinetobacter sp.]
NSITEASQTGFTDEPTTGDVFSCQASSHKVAALSVDKDGVVSIQTQNVPHLGTKVNLELAPYSDAAATVPMTSADFIVGTGKEIRAWKCRPKQDATGVDIMYLPASCR